VKYHRTRILTRRDVEKLSDMRSVIRVVEEGFREMGRGRTNMPPKLYLDLPEFGGDFRAMPAYAPRFRACSLKWVNAHPRNPKKGLPSVMAFIILSDPRNGLPLCFMDGTLATTLRTGAAGAVAAKYLARKDSRIVGLVGCGVQARAQIEALRGRFGIREVRVWDYPRGCADRFIRSFKNHRYRFLACGDVRGCVSDCDIVVTATPSRKPLVRLEWLKPGVHINAIGADAAGKQELDPAILKEAKVVVDSWAQAAHSGEINVPVENKILDRSDIYAELGEIVAGKKKGRTDPREITVFDSTGLAIQDLAIASFLERKACRRHVGRQISLVGP